MKKTEHQMATECVTGGVLTDLDGNQRLYYTDPSGYVSELVKHGY